MAIVTRRYWLLIFGGRTARASLVIMRPETRILVSLALLEFIVLGPNSEERCTRSLVEVLIEAVEMARFVVDEGAIAWKGLEKTSSEGRIDTRL